MTPPGRLHPPLGAPVPARDLVVRYRNCPMRSPSRRWDPDEAVREPLELCG